jgi:DNA polymerase IV (archaeal DinB-like DNA polymerase)
LGLVLFIDMDSFYASCEELRHPELRGKPFVVGTSDEQNKMKGVVETASYAAKRSGVHSAMPTSMALKMKKEIIYVPSDHDYYDAMSMKVMQRLKTFGYKMEMLSVDEAALDLAGMEYEEAERLGEKIKGEINNGMGLPCTIGIAHGKIFAKMVCDDAKPDGLKLVKQENMTDFLMGKSVIKILGVGRKTSEKLALFGIRTIGDLAKADPAKLTGAVGSFGIELHNLANGIDESKVIDQWKVLSISRERTLESRTNDLDKANRMLDALAEEVMRDVDKNGFSFKTITVKARYSDFTEKVRGKTLPAYSNSALVLKKTAHDLIEELVAEKPFRKVGVRVSSFTSGKAQKKLL